MATELVYQVGDVVKFVNINRIGDSLPSYSTNNIPVQYLKHGMTTVGHIYFKEYGKIVWAGNGYYAVEYKDFNENPVCLGFTKTHIELVRTDSDKKDIDYTKLDRIIIEDQVKEEIISVLKQHKNSRKLFEEWGLGEIMEYGRGMTFMFYGPPGTGKTGMAHAIAAAMGTDLLIMSAAEIQSSEPGGANRNIQQAFASAKSKKNVLFIDECDSLITSRGDLGMILASEVNTLLTEIEKFEGVCILATNRIEHMDEALERRISLIVEFPHPNQEKRLAIWKTLLPAKMPLDADVNIEDLSKPGLTGGQIKNVILAAARMALATDAPKVTKAHFDTAMNRIKASKNLMGTASRYHQDRVDDFGKGSSRGHDLGPDKEMSNFLDIEAKKIKDRKKDTDISPDNK